MIESLSTAMANRKGFALPTLIILMILLAILAAGTVSFVAQSLRHDALRAQKHQALMAAQGGLMRAAYETLQNNTYSPSGAQLAGRQFYSYEYTGGGGGGGGAGNWVYIDASASGTTSGNRNVFNWNIVNTNPSSSYTITHITPSWNPTNRTIQQIWLGGIQRWSGSINTSGTLINITDHIIPANSTVTGNYFRFNSPMQSHVISAIFHFSDGSTVSAQLYPSNTPTPPPGGNPTVIRSTGRFEDTSNNVTMRQTMIATFEVNTGALKIKRYNETTGHIMP